MKNLVDDPIATGWLHSSGSWSNEILWELYVTNILPPAELCTAVMCVAVSGNKMVLARNKRGWGLLGGHIEDGETLEAALRREALEEGGFIIDKHQIFAFRKINSKRPMPHQQPGKTYPFPTSYIIYYLATTTKALQKPTGEEIIESSSFTIADLNELQSTDEAIISLGWAIHRHSLALRR